jgi:hypothetical protein
MGGHKGADDGRKLSPFLSSVTGKKIPPKLTLIFRGHHWSN